MAAIKLKILVEELDNVMLEFDQIKVYRSTAGQGGPFIEITGPGTRIDLDADTTLYEYIDTSGDPAYWYRFSFYNSSTSAEGTASTAIQGGAASGLYCTLQDIRDEGFAETDYSDARVTTIIQLASAAIEKFTGRWFEARELTFLLDGSGARAMRIGHPIIDISSVSVDDVALELDDMIVYNRHVASGLRQPDDREDPRLEFPAYYYQGGVYHPYPAYWPEGRQNVSVTGTFGYTEYDGTATGRTPLLLQHLCKLLVARELTPIGDQDERIRTRERWRTTNFKTRDQSISFAAPNSASALVATGGLTGDHEIDSLLMMFRRPLDIGAV